jgi:penicillin V acylase-like amidase (Ntn superfamily)
MVFSLQLQPAYGCSAFSFNTSQDTFVAKNYDWFRFHGHGAVFVNKRGMAKIAELLRQGSPMQWVSRYGSVTFNQIGQEFPMGGMNEAGLVVEILSLRESEQIPETDSRPALNESQWVQYQLDSYGSVSEVIQNAPSFRVEQAFMGTHYFVCDRTGECGVFEYINHQLVIHSGAAMPIKAITNSTYEESMQYWSDLQKRAGKADRSSSKSLPRFGQILEGLQNQARAETAPFDYGFNILADASKESFLVTQWSMMYAQNNRTIEFRTRDNSELKTLSLANLDFACTSAPLMVDMQLPASQDVAPLLQPVSDQANRDLIGKNWLLLGDRLRTLAGDYPQKFTHCIIGKEISFRRRLP